jgi:hypothetical protein
VLLAKFLEYEESHTLNEKFGMAGRIIGMTMPQNALVVFKD